VMIYLKIYNIFILIFINDKVSLNNVYIYK